MGIHERMVREFAKARASTGGINVPVTAQEIRNQRQGIKGKPDSSNLPSYSSGEYAWTQLDPGKEDDAQNADASTWDKHFVATNSSNVQQVFYSTASQQLKAIFKEKKRADGTVIPKSRYVYFNVPFQVYNRLEYKQRSGGSVGSEFWKLMRIKPKAHRYNYRKLLGEGGGEGRQVRGAMHVHGMPALDEDPLYASHTAAKMREERLRNQARYDRMFGRAEPRSSRKGTTGGGSARSKKANRRN